MTPRQLPESPNLEQLKKQAKSLLHSAQAGDAGALDALRVAPGAIDARRSARSTRASWRCTTRNR